MATMDSDVNLTNLLSSPVENFILIWLDGGITELTDEHQDALHLFRSLVNNIQLFSNPDEFDQFIQRVQDERLFVITSGSLGKAVVPKLQANMPTYSVYIYCTDRKHHETWAIDFPKVKGVYTDLLSIQNALRRDVRQVTNDLIPIHPLPNRKSKELQQAFSCSSLLKQILVHTDSNEQRKNEFVSFSRDHYRSNASAWNVIDQFENTGYQQLSPVEWYTSECFIYGMLHRALRLYDIEILHRIAFFVSDLHNQIKDRHAQSADPQKLTVYYSQRITRDQFQNYEMKSNDLISFNTFLLATIERQPSLSLAKQSATDPEFISILFQIEIDRATSSFPFVSLDDLDYYHDTDRHILFSLNPVFRITQFEKGEDELWQMNVILIDEHQPPTSALRHSHESARDFSALGRMMINTGQLDKAKHIFEVLLKNAPVDDDKQLAYLHRYLGCIHEKTKNFPAALSHYKHWLTMQARCPSESHISTACVHAHIGTIEQQQGQLDQAIRTFVHALQIAVHVSKPDAGVVAALMNNIGEICILMGDFIKAVASLQRALKHLHESRTSGSEVLANIHRNLSVAFENLGQRKEAVEHASNAVTVASRQFGGNHPVVKKHQDRYNAIAQKKPSSS